MDNFLNEINVKGVLYAISGGTGGGVTSGEVQTMLEDYTYDKETIDDKISSGGGSSSAVTVLSGDVITISGDVIELSESLDKVSGDVIVLSGDVNGLETKIDTLSGNVYTKSETSGKTELDTEFGKYYKKTETSSKTEIDDALNQKQDILIAGSGISIVNNVISASGGGITSGEVMDIVSGYTYDKDTIDDKIASGGTFDPTLYYKKSETSGKTEIQNALDLKLDASAFTESDYYKKSETSGKTELDSAFSAITKTIEDNEQVIAKALNDLNDKKVESGDVVDIVSGYTYDKNEIDDKIASGITSGEVQTMIDQSISGKANSSDVYTKTETYTKTEVDNKFWCGTESEWSQISGSTQSGTLYLIY